MSGSLNINGNFKVSGDVSIANPLDTSLPSRPNTEYFSIFETVDKNDRIGSFIQTSLGTDGSTSTSIGARCYNDGNKTNRIIVTVDRDGNSTYNVTSPANFRSAIGALASSYINTGSIKTISPTYWGTIGSGTSGGVDFGITLANNYTIYFSWNCGNNKFSVLINDANGNRIVNKSVTLS